LYQDIEFEYFPTKRIYNCKIIKTRMRFFTLFRKLAILLHGAFPTVQTTLDPVAPFGHVYTVSNGEFRCSTVATPANVDFFRFYTALWQYVFVH
jgi:hypothetical protein